MSEVLHIFEKIIPFLCIFYPSKFKYSCFQTLVSLRNRLQRVNSLLAQSYSQSFQLSQILNNKRRSLLAYITSIVYLKKNLTNLQTLEGFTGSQTCKTFRSDLSKSLIIINLQRDKCFKFELALINSSKCSSSKPL